MPQKESHHGWKIFHVRFLFFYVRKIKIYVRKNIFSR